ncbi:helix-turn-helix domain-containing protein [Halobacillus naozhouensis]|uniref:Helix-turn-helix domain-containing protein n=1 Tax=Halobacillus naozhouensis TaxID=554880 RepID=A0ABY8IZR0_9BACI|nr:helix-turn-helix domain-containing protein [Halobacillus naozhouensis]WFT75301.1 helix-turn-helix domain-containing protein [Halobacillus naozhouensis]
MSQLIGYASGYYSKICEHNVLFKEVSCKGKGDSECRYVGKSLNQWEGEVDSELPYYENTTIVQELETAYEKLLEERNNLSRSVSIHKKLTEELINGNNLQSMADVVYQTTQKPIIIEDAAFHQLAYAGLTHERFEEVKSDVPSFLEEKKHINSFYQTSKRSSVNHQRLMAPIILEKKVFGYCSFVYDKKNEEPSEVDQLILERVATVCSLYMLNEKNSFEATERMKGHFLEQIIYGHFSSSKQEILKRGTYVNLNLERPYYIVALEYNNQHNHSKEELFFHEEVMERVLQYFKNCSHVLIGQRNGNIIFLIQKDFLKESINHLCDTLIGFLTKCFPMHTFKMGISSLTKDIQLASEFYDEAITALQMATSFNEVTHFEDLGVVGILIHSNNKKAIKQKAKQLLGTLYEQKDDHVEFIKTLYVFLSNGGNLEKTMDKLSLSMSGLRYRIKKIESLLGQDLRNPEFGYHLFITLQALVVEGEIKIE